MGGHAKVDHILARSSMSYTRHSNSFLKFEKERKEWNSKEQEWVEGTKTKAVWRRYNKEKVEGAGRRERKNKSMEHNKRS